jgi:hypothetical protein
VDNSSSPLTHIEAVEKDWLESGISPDLIRLNREAVREVAGKQLQAWIENFISTFRDDSRLKQVLSTSVWFSRRTCKTSLDNRQIAGLAVELRPETWESCKFLISKLKILRYRLKKIDPEVKILFLSDPCGERAIGILIKTGEVIFASLPVEVRGKLG